MKLWSCGSWRLQLGVEFLLEGVLFLEGLQPRLAEEITLLKLAVHLVQAQGLI